MTPARGHGEPSRPFLWGCPTPRSLPDSLPCRPPSSRQNRTGLPFPVEDVSHNVYPPPLCSRPRAPWRHFGRSSRRWTRNEPLLRASPTCSQESSFLGGQLENRLDSISVAPPCNKSARPLFTHPSRERKARGAAGAPLPRVLIIPAIWRPPPPSCSLEVGSLRARPPVPGDLLLLCRVRLLFPSPFIPPSLPRPV